MAELGRKLHIAADQICDGKAMPFGLKDVMVVNVTELADRAILSGRVKKSLKLL